MTGLQSLSSIMPKLPFLRTPEAPKSAPGMVKKACNQVKTFGHWIAATPNAPQARSEYRLIRWIQDMLDGPQPKQPTGFERGCTVLKRVGITAGYTLGAAAVTFCVGQGLSAGGTELKSRFKAETQKDECDLTFLDTAAQTEAGCDTELTGLQNAMQLTGSGLEMLGGGLISAARNVFVGFSVPVYGAAYKAPMLGYEAAKPYAIDAFEWLNTNAYTPVSPYLNTAVGAVSKVFMGITTPLIELTEQKAGSVADLFKSIFSK